MIFLESASLNETFLCNELQSLYDLRSKEPLTRNIDTDFIKKTVKAFLMLAQDHFYSEELKSCFKNKSEMFQFVEQLLTTIVSIVCSSSYVVR